METTIYLALMALMFANAAALGVFAYNTMAERAETKRSLAEMQERLEMLTAPAEEKEMRVDKQRLFNEGLENILNFGIGGGAHGDD